MEISKIHSMVSTIRQNSRYLNKSKLAFSPELIKLRKFNSIGVEASKYNAWWHAGYREAKTAEEAIRKGIYEREFYKPIYRESGGLNMKIFHPNWDPYGEDGLI